MFPLSLRTYAHQFQTVDALHVPLSPIRRLPTLLKRAGHQHVDDVVDVVVM